MHHNPGELSVNFGKCMTMSQPPGLLPAFINFKWLTQIIDIEVVWCEVLSHHPFCTMVHSTGQKKRLLLLLSHKCNYGEWQRWFHSSMFWNTNLICSTYKTKWQKAQTDSAAWPCEAKAWKKKKEIIREKQTMDVGLWGWLGWGGERCSNYGQKV